MRQRRDKGRKYFATAALYSMWRKLITATEDPTISDAPVAQSCAKPPVRHHQRQSLTSRSFAGAKPACSPRPQRPNLKGTTPTVKLIADTTKKFAHVIGCHHAPLFHSSGASDGTSAASANAFNAGFACLRHFLSCTVYNDLCCARGCAQTIMKGSKMDALPISKHKTGNP